MSSSSEIQLRVATPFGSAGLARCTLQFVARLDGSGLISLEGLAILGASPCPDIRACKGDVDVDERPWLGRITTDGAGGFVAAFDACLDTCVGWFEGPLELPLERIGRAWRLRADWAPMGDTGLEIRGEAWLDSPDTRRAADLRLTTDR